MKKTIESRSKLLRYNKLIITVLVTVSFLLSTGTFSYWATSVQGTNNQNTMTFTIGEYIREVTEYIFDGGLTSGDDIVTSDNDDTVDIIGRVQGDAALDTGAGNDTISIDSNVMDLANIITGSGNDTITLGRSIVDDAMIDTGDGDDTITVTSRMLNDAIILTGTGNDTVNINTAILNNAVIETGSEDDTIYIEKIGSGYNGTIDAGSGNDIIIISVVKRNSAIIDGGSGDDTLYLENYTISQWNKGIDDSFTGFETIVLKDGIIYN